MRANRIITVRTGDDYMPVVPEVEPGDGDWAAKRALESGRASKRLGRALIAIIVLLGVVTLLAWSDPAITQQQRLYAIRLFPLASIFHPMPDTVFPATTTTVPQPVPAQITNVVVDLSAVRTTRTHVERFARWVPRFEAGAHVRYFNDTDHDQHYALLCYLSKLAPPGAVMVELGTALGLSAMALACNPGVSRVLSFDVMDCEATLAAHNGITRERLRTELPQVRFLTGADPMGALWAPDVLKASVILLDTYHEPDTRPFERGFVDFLVRNRFAGILVLDDIWVNAQMTNWWTTDIVAQRTSLPPPRRYDLTPWGHASGTGVVDFTGTMDTVSPAVFPLPRQPMRASV